MAVKWFKAKLSDFSIDSFFRMDYKFHEFINKSIWNIFETNNKNLIDFKDILTPYYKDFKFEDDLEYFGIPTGNEYLNAFGDIISFQSITKEEHPNRLKYEINNNCILISSLKGAKTPALSFDFDLSNYVFSNGFYIFEVNEKWNKKFMLYILRTKKLKNILDNHIYRGIGISTYKEDDFLKFQIPVISLNSQNKIVEQIQPLETEIERLKNSKLKPLDIINQVFGEEFGFSADFYKAFGKGMTAGTQQSNVKEKLVYKISLSQVATSSIFRISGRFHNPRTQFLKNILFAKPTIKVKNVITEIIKGVQPEYNTEGDIAVVKIANLKNGYIDLENPELVLQSFFDKLETKKQIQKNDVIICCTGKVSLGKIDIYEIEDDAVLTVDNYLIRLNDNILPYFFIYFFRSILGAFQIERDFTGATNQIHLYDKQIIEFDIPNFPLEKQNEIVLHIKTQIDAQNLVDLAIEAKQQEINEIIENAIKHAQ